MSKKCDKCQEPLETKHKYDMYFHEPCISCQWGIFGFLGGLSDNFRPKNEENNFIQYGFKPDFYFINDDFDEEAEK
ncbi:MAG: hypothetical protein ACTSQ8_07960 [Candidatus Helarchaeota archaeon]